MKLIVFQKVCLAPVTIEKKVFPD